MKSSMHAVGDQHSEIQFADMPTVIESGPTVVHPLCNWEETMVYNS